MENPTFHLEAVIKSKEEMQDGLYKGLLDSLGDPYSVYYTEKRLELQVPLLHPLIPEESGACFAV